MNIDSLKTYIKLKNIDRKTSFTKKMTTIRPIQFTLDNPETLTYMNNTLRDNIGLIEMCTWNINCDKNALEKAIEYVKKNKNCIMCLQEVNINDYNKIKNMSSFMKYNSIISLAYNDNPSDILLPFDKQIFDHGCLTIWQKQLVYLNLYRYI